MRITVRRYWPAWYIVPGGDALGQGARPPGRVVLGQDLVAAEEHPVDIGDAPRARVDAHQRPLPPRLVQREGLLGGEEQGEQRGVQLRRAAEEPVGDDLLVARRQHPPELATLPRARAG